MNATLKGVWRYWMFPSELNVVEVELALNQGEVVKAVAVELKLGDKTLLNVSLTPTDERVVRLDNLMPLLRDATTDAMDGVAPQTLVLKVGDQVCGSCKLVPCRVRLARATAEDVVRKSFLNFTGREVKLLPPDAREVLYWYLTDDWSAGTKACVDACWWNAATKEVRAKQQLLEVETTESGGLLKVDVSPKVLEAPADGEWSLVSYSVRVNARVMRYRMVQQGRNLAPVTGVRYRNAFGVDDTFYFFGSVEEKLKPTYSAARIGGVTRNYLITAQPEWEANTGHMTLAMERLLRDLAVARRAWLMDDDEEIVLTGCDVKQSNEWCVAPVATVSWREAGDGARLASPVGVRTFDGSFDEAFF